MSARDLARLLAIACLSVIKWSSTKRWLVELDEFLPFNFRIAFQTVLFSIYHCLASFSGSTPYYSAV